MLLKDRRTRDLVRVDDLHELTDPFRKCITGRAQSGEEEQEETSFDKEQLVFPSGESLPRCWLDVNYQTAPALAESV